MTAPAALWLSIVLGAFAQVFLKRGVASENPGQKLSYAGLLSSPWLWAWGICFVFATALWLVALSRVNLSYAFPMLSLGYPIVAVLSALTLGERISGLRWVAIMVITVGVAIIWRSN